MSELLEATKKKSNQIEYMTIPDRVTVKPLATKNFRLGLEKTKEKFIRVPGTKYRYAPSKVGHTYKTGLEHIPPARRTALEKALGRKLDNEFYVDLVYVMDGSNPHGHIMDLTVPFELVVYLTFLDSELVAVSKSDTVKGKKPFAEWYIENDELEAEEQEKDRDMFTQVIEIFGGLSNTRRASYCKILGISVTGLSPRVASAKLWDSIMEKGREGIKIQKKVLDISKWSDEKIAVSEEVEDAVVYNILRKNSAQDLVYGEEILGSSKEQVVSKLMGGENGALRMSIKNQLLTHNGK